MPAVAKKRAVPRPFSYHWGSGHIVGADEIQGLRTALKKTPKLRPLLKKLVQ